MNYKFQDIVFSEFPVGDESFEKFTEYIKGIPDANKFIVNDRFLSSDDVDRMHQMKHLEVLQLTDIDTNDTIKIDFPDLKFLYVKSYTTYVKLEFSNRNNSTRYISIYNVDLRNEIDFTNLPNLEHFIMDFHQRQIPLEPTKLNYPSISNCKSLRTLFLSYVNMDELTFDWFVGLDQLSALELCTYVIDVKKFNVESLGLLTSLKKFALSNNCQDRIINLDGIKNLRNLEVLVINSIYFNPIDFIEDFENLVEVCVLRSYEGERMTKTLNMKSLGLKSIILPDYRIGNIEQMKCLEQIDCFVDDSNIDKILSLPKIKIVRAEVNEVPRIPVNTTLKKLNINVKSVNNIAEFIDNLQGIENLRLTFDLSCVDIQSIISIENDLLEAIKRKSFIGHFSVEPFSNYKEQTKLIEDIFANSFQRTKNDKYVNNDLYGINEKLASESLIAELMNHSSLDDLKDIINKRGLLRNAHAHNRDDGVCRFENIKIDGLIDELKGQCVNDVHVTLCDPSKSYTSYSSLSLDIPDNSYKIRNFNVPGLEKTIQTVSIDDDELTKLLCDSGDHHAYLVSNGFTLLTYNCDGCYYPLNSLFSMTQLFGSLKSSIWTKGSSIIQLIYRYHCYYNQSKISASSRIF